MLIGRRLSAMPNLGPLTGSAATIAFRSASAGRLLGERAVRRRKIPGSASDKLRSPPDDLGYESPSARTGRIQIHLAETRISPLAAVRVGDEDQCRRFALAFARFRAAHLRCQRPNQEPCL